MLGLASRSIGHGKAYPDPLLGVGNLLPYFRHNARMALGGNDRDRAEKMLRGVKGKRLTYR